MSSSMYKLFTINYLTLWLMIEVKDLRGVRFAFSNAEPTSIFQRLKDAFPQNRAYRLFTQPNILGSGDKIAWQSDTEGTVTHYNSLSETDKHRAERLLQDQVSVLMRLA